MFNVSFKILINNWESTFLESSKRTGTPCMSRAITPTEIVEASNKVLVSFYRTNALISISSYLTRQLCFCWNIFLQKCFQMHKSEKLWT